MMVDLQESFLNFWIADKKSVNLVESLEGIIHVWCGWPYISFLPILWSLDQWIPTFALNVTARPKFLVLGYWAPRLDLCHRIKLLQEAVLWSI